MLNTFLIFFALSVIKVAEVEGVEVELDTSSGSSNMSLTLLRILEAPDEAVGMDADTDEECNTLESDLLSGFSSSANRQIKTRHQVKRREE